MALELYQSNFENAMAMLQTPTVNVSVLTSAPQAAIFLHGLVVMASVVRDTSLENNYTMDMINLLKTPRSFKASLYQVASSMSSSFRAADQSMFKIKINLDDVPDTLTSMVNAYTKPTDRNSRFMMDLNLRSLTDVARICTEEAEKVRVKFDGTLDLLDEMSQVTIATNGFNTKNLAEAEKEIKIQEAAKKRAEEDAERMARKVEEMKKNVAKADADFDKAVKDSTNIWKQLGATFVDGLGSAMNMLGGLFGKNGGEDGMKCIGAGYQAAMNQSGEETGSPAPPQCTPSSKPSTRNNFAQAMEMRKDVLLAARQALERLEDKNSAERKKLGDIADKLLKLDITKVELDEIIKYLEQAITLLGEVTKEWRILQDFFVTMETMIKSPLAKSLKRFDEIVQNGLHEDSPLIRGAMIMEGFKVVATSLSVGRSAGIYSQVSKKFVTPLIDEAATKMALTREKGAVELRQMQFKNDQRSKESMDFIQEKLQESSLKAYNQLVQFHQKFQAAMPQISVEN